MTFPKTVLIADNLTSSRFAGASASQLASNGVDAWAYALRGDVYGIRRRALPTTQALEPYDLVIANLNPSLIPLYAKLVQERPARQKWVALIEGSGDDYLEPSRDLLATLDASDLVVNINASTGAYIQSLTRSRVAELGIPYPVEAIRRLATPFEQRQDVVLVCPKMNRGPSIRTAQETGLRMRAFAFKVSRKLENLPRFLKERSMARDMDAKRLASRLPAGSEVVLEHGLESFLVESGKCRLWVNLDTRTTWGRYVLDAAALGVPIVTTASTAHGPRLFPQTTVSSVFDIEQAKAMAKRLVKDDGFAQETIRYASRALDDYGFDRCAERLLEELNKSAAPR